jgi:hypothetical protein
MNMRQRSGVAVLGVLAVLLSGAGLAAPARAAPLLYEADAGTNSIQKITPGGMVSTFVSGLNQPQGLAFDQC